MRKIPWGKIKKEVDKTIREEGLGPDDKITISLFKGDNNKINFNVTVGALHWAE